MRIQSLIRAGSLSLMGTIFLGMVQLAIGANGDNCASTPIVIPATPGMHKVTVDLSPMGGYANDFTPPGGTNGRDAVFTLPPVPNGWYMVMNTAFSNGMNGSVLSLYRDNPPGGVTCTDFLSSYDDAPGSGTALVQRTSPGGAQPWSIVLESGGTTTTLPGGSAMNVYVYLYPGGAPSGDTCASPIAISSLPYNLTNMDLNGYGNDVAFPSFPNNGANSDAIWHITASLTSGTQVTVDTLGSSFPTFLAVINGGGGCAGTVVATDRFGQTLPNQSNITFTAQTGGDYYVVLEGLYGAMSLANLHVKTGGPAGAAINDDKPLQELGLGDVQTLAFSPDEKYVVTAGNGGTVLWDTATGTRLRTLPNTSSDVAFSFDGTYIGFAQGLNTIIMNAESGALVRTLTHTGPKDGKQILAFCPTAPYVAVGYDSEHLVELWNYDTGTFLRNAGEYGAQDEAYVKCLTFSPDGNDLIFGHGDANPIVGDPPPTVLVSNVSVWSVATGTYLRSFTDHPTGTPIVSVEARRYLGTDYLLSSSQQVTSIGNAISILRDYLTGAPVSVMMEAPNKQITGSTMNSDKTIVAVGNSTDRTLEIYNVPAPLPSYSVALLGVPWQRFSPSSTYLGLLQPTEATAALWSAGATTATETLALDGYTGVLQASAPVTISGVEYLWTGHTTGKADRWSVTSGNSLQELGIGSLDKYLAFSDDGTIAYFARKNPTPPNPSNTPATIFAQNTSTGAILWPIFPLTGIPNFFSDPNPNNLSVSGDQSRIAAASVMYVCVWNTSDQSLVNKWNLDTIFGTGAAAQVVALNSDGSKIFFYCSGLNPAPVNPGRIYDVTAGFPNGESAPPLAQFANLDSGGSADYVVSASFSHNSSILATCNFAGNTALRDGTTGAYLRSLFTYGEGIAGPARFTFNDALVAVGSGGGTTRLYDVATGTLLRKLAPKDVTFSNQVTSLSFIASERRIATGCNDGRTFVWELDPPRAIFVAAGDPDPNNNALTVQTTSLTAYAAEISAGRDYVPEDIRILSSFRDAPFVIPIDYNGDSIDDSYAATTKANLQDAILNWGEQKDDYGRRLFLYMTDHGLRESGETHFILNACETISATELDAILDQYQDPAQNGGKINEVTLVVDCCYSGAFVTACAPTGSQKRTVIASTTATNLAVFLPSPDLTSFTSEFFGAGYMGASIKSSYDSGKSFFQSFSIASQTPQIVDEAGAGLGTATGFLGKSWIYASGGSSYTVLGDLGTAGVSPTGTLSPGTTVTLTVDVSTNEVPSAVYAQVLSPAPDTLSQNPVTNLPLVTLTRPNPGSQPDHWEGQYQVTEDGTYAFGIYGRYSGARRSETEVVYANVSEPDPEETRPLVAVVVAGQDDPVAQTGEIDDQAVQLTARAYLTAKERQYPTANIKVLGPAILATLGTSIPQNATYATFVSAVNTVVSGQTGARLFISLIGPTETGTDNFKFQSGQTISPAQLDALLDPLQVADPTLEVVVLMDCPKAGRYQSALDQANRFLVLGTTSTGDGFFLPSPTYQSYSRRFLEASRQGRDLYNSNLAGEEFATLFSLPSPILTDGTGQAIPLLAVNKYLGRRGVFASDAGELATICNVAPDQIPTSINTVQIYVDFQEGLVPTQVTAQAVPDPPSAIVTDAPTIVMTRVSPTSFRWYVPAAQMATLFPTNGSFLVSYEASYPTTDTLPRESQADGTRVGLVDPSGDIYEPSPYFDSSSATTKNVLTDRSPQIHNLHTVGDQDWGIVYQIADTSPLPFSLHFALNLPTSAIMKVELYENGPTSPPTQTANILWTESTHDVSWLGTGLKQIYFKVSLQSGGVSPFLGYQVTFFQNTGANNGIATTIGSRSLEDDWSTNSVPGGSQGFNVMRSPTGANGTYVQINATPVPVPSTTGACPGAGCAEYIDTGLNPLTVYFYQIYVVPSSGSPTAWTGAFYGYTSAETATPTPTPSPSVTPSPTPTPSPSRTPTPSPTPQANSAVNWELYQ